MQPCFGTYLILYMLREVLFDLNAALRAKLV